LKERLRDLREYLFINNKCLFVYIFDNNKRSIIPNNTIRPHRIVNFKKTSEIFKKYEKLIKNNIITKSKFVNIER
tara:strand:- start:16 stop:240 length:225 start_codon:yes stop_codon:yes gene_type:complete